VIVMTTGLARAPGGTVKVSPGAKITPPDGPMSCEVPASGTAASSAGGGSVQAARVSADTKPRRRGVQGEEVIAAEACCAEVRSDSPAPPTLPIGARSSLRSPA